MHCAVKLCSETVILGAWVDSTTAERVLDIGTGCGILSLMTAQRNGQAHITSVEIDPASCIEAQTNFASSPWATRITGLVADVFAFSPGQSFDYIICNPPYFSRTTLSGTQRRQIAKHDQGFLRRLPQFVASHLSGSGKFGVVLPTDAVSGFVNSCNVHAIYLNHRLDLQLREGMSPVRSCLEFARTLQKPKIESLVLSQNERITREYFELVGEFYISLPGWKQKNRS